MSQNLFKALNKNRSRCLSCICSLILTQNKQKCSQKKHRNEIKYKQRNFIFFEFCEYYFAGFYLGIPELLKVCVFSTQLLRTVYISWHKIKVQKNQNTIVNSRFFLNFDNFFLIVQNKNLCHDTQHNFLYHATFLQFSQTGMKVYPTSPNFLREGNIPKLIKVR